MDLEIKDFFKILVKRWWMIGLVVALSCGGIALYHSLYAKPQYVASTKLIVTNANHDGGLAVPDSNEISSNMMLIGTYKEIIASPAILEKVMFGYPELRMTLDELMSSVSVHSSSGSQVLSISVTNSSYGQAVIAANAIAQMFKSEIPNIMNVDNVTILSQSRMTDSPSSVSHGLTFKLMIALILSLMCSVGIVLLWEYFDDTIKTEKDVLHYLGKPMLGTVIRFKKSDTRSEAKKTNRVGETINGVLNQQV